MPSVFVLSIHADYACRNSGACCSADWDVPVEVPVYERFADALKVGRLLPVVAAHDGGPALIVDDDVPEDTGAILARTASGDCVFYDRPANRCGAHRSLGHDALPSTCRHFPRLAVRDARGTFISLTHFCPTAASLLFVERPIEIVADPPVFPMMDYEGLEVGADEWPPLLKDRMLMDHVSYSAWERHMVARCADDSSSPEDVLATLRRDSSSLMNFNPLRESLLVRIESLPVTMARAGVPERLTSSLVHVTRVMAAVPDDLRPAEDQDGLDRAYEDFVRSRWRRWAAPLRRYLAAKAFANWTAYQGRGLQAIVTGLEAALALVRVEASRRCRDSGSPLDEEQLREAIRAADFALNHLAVGETLAEEWSAVSVAAP